MRRVLGRGLVRVLRRGVGRGRCAAAGSRSGGVLARADEDADHLAARIEDRRAEDAGAALEIDVEDAPERLALLRRRVGASLEPDPGGGELARLREERLELAAAGIGVRRDEAVEPLAGLRDGSARSQPLSLCPIFAFTTLPSA
jgi:hypothetical protein